MKTMQLGEVLTPEQLDRVIHILNTTSDTIEQAQALKTYLRPFAVELEDKGVVSDYLAYWLVAAKPHLLAQAAARN